MSTQKSDQHHRHSVVEFQVTGALLLIALGAVFLAQQAGYLSHSANWWVIFLFFPALGLLWNARTGYQDHGKIGGAEIVEIVLGALLLLLTVIFIFDPNWSFTRGWRIFPDADWDRIWRFVVAGFGIALVVVGIVRRWTVVAVFGAVVTIIGGVFVFDVDWNYVWPLALIVPGLWWLYNALRNRTE
jgi:hypothetical protein